MASREQIELLRRQLWEAVPMEFCKQIDQKQVGMEAILQLLLEADQTVTAGMLSEAMNVSTARMAVLLRKMSEKGLIVKETHALDGRVTVVRLTEHGEAIAGKKREEALRQIGAVIDKVGMERMQEFIRISKEIKEVIRCPEGTVLFHGRNRPR